MNDNTNIEYFSKGEKMSILSRYYHKRYMMKTLSERMSSYGGNEGLENLANDVNEVRSMLSTMNETYEFLKKCGVFYLATIDGNQPRVRPFGALNMFEDKIYLQTGKVKNVSKQMENLTPEEFLLNRLVLSEKAFFHSLPPVQSGDSECGQPECHHAQSDYNSFTFHIRLSFKFPFDNLPH